MSIVVLAFACGPRPRAADTPVLSRATRTRGPQQNAAPLVTALDVKVKNGVEFAFHVTNTADKKLEVKFANGQTHELVVYNASGREVWRWSTGQMFTQSLQNKVLRQSDSLTYDLRWKDAPAGRYVAVATLSSANFPVEQRTEFVVR